MSCLHLSYRLRYVCFACSQAAKAAKKKNKDGAHGGKVIDRPDSAPEGGDDGEDEAAVATKKEKPQPSYAVISTEELCVRVNSLVHCTHNIKQLASRIAYELGDTEAYVDPLAPDFDPTDRSAVDKVPLCGSIMVLESCTEQLVAFISAKLIFHEMENELLLGLYVPTPERGIRIDGTLNAMDEVMDVLYDMLPDEVRVRLPTHAPLVCRLPVLGPRPKYAHTHARVYNRRISKWCSVESLPAWSR